MKETRNIYSPTGLPGAIEAINAVGYPCKITITSGADRSLEQNRLQWMWIKEASEQLREYTPEQYRAYCKLHLGVPIMREDGEFRGAYDRLIKPHSYPDKLDMMVPPLDFPITRLMSVKQKARYLEAMRDHFTGLGVNLTIPPDTRYD